jgi:hypothetical protein
MHTRLLPVRHVTTLAVIARYWPSLIRVPSLAGHARFLKWGQGLNWPPLEHHLIYLLRIVRLLTPRLLPFGRSAL